MNNPLISVIVPVYKAEAYLKKCINSIINQTYKNLEIILVMTVRLINAVKFVMNLQSEILVFVLFKANGLKKPLNC